MSNYRKFIAALVGALLIGLNAIFGIGDGTSIFGIGADQIVHTIVGVLTAVGVFAVPNEPDPPKVS